jgi:hypothetical protein
MNRLWKGTLVGLAAFACVAGLARVAGAQACGDDNNSGTAFQISDCIRKANVVVGFQTASALCNGSSTACADLNGDGQVSLSDVVLCQNKVAGAPDPFTLCVGPGSAIACPGGTATISSDITQSQIWPTGCLIRLDGLVFVASNVTLTIQPNVTIKAKKTPTPPSTLTALIFRRGAKLSAVGDSENPIVFTSDGDEVGDLIRRSGDWGGVSFMGRAPVNVPGGTGLAEGLTGVEFGGTDPLDSSGTMKFLRIEFAGRTLSVDNELNIFTMNGVGRGTTIENIHAHIGNDDCHEWFGGTVNAKFLVGTGCRDDGFDWQLGYTGNVQFALYEAYNAESSSGSSGFECDNNENGFNNSPRSAPKFCNVTMLGSKVPGTLTAGADGALLRRGTAGTLANTIFTKFGRRGFTLDGDPTSAQVCSGPGTLRTDGPLGRSPLAIMNSIFFDNGPGAPGTTHAGGTPSPCSAADALSLWMGSYGVTVTDPLIPIPVSWPVDDPRPVDPSGTATVRTGGLDCSTLDGFFVNATDGSGNKYIGAFAPGGTNWLKPTPASDWVSFATS